MHFQYPEDGTFFLNFLAHGDDSLFKQKFEHLFDFRDPKTKREEFNSIRAKVFKNLIEKHGKVCQLRISNKCSSTDEYHVDHFIPLKSNELNKNIRKMKRFDSKKIPAQSFGSNHEDNFVLACKHCNLEKKYFFYKPSYRVLMIDNTKNKDNQFLLPQNDTRIELIKWNKFPQDFVSQLEKLKPDLIAFNGKVVQDEWMSVVLQIKEHPVLKDVPIFVSGILGVLASLHRWMQSGVSEFLFTTEPKGLVDRYVEYLHNPRLYKRKKKEFSLFGLCLKK